MFLSRFIENLALALIGRYPSEFFAGIILTVLDPFYQWAERLDSLARQSRIIILPW